LQAVIATASVIQLMDSTFHSIHSTNNKILTVKPLSQHAPYYSYTTAFIMRQYCLPRSTL